MISIIAIIIGVVILIITTLSHMCEKIGGYYYGSASDSFNPNGLNTYVVFGQLGGFKEEKLDAELKTHGFKKLTVPAATGRGHRVPRFATFVWVSTNVDGQFDPLAFKIQCQTKNAIEGTRMETLTRKDRLYFDMMNNEPDIANKYFAPTWYLRDFEWSSQKEGTWYITRPVGGSFFGGKDIIRVTSEKDLRNAREFYRQRAKNIIISEYLGNPYLYKGLKFHLRLYFMVRVVAGKPVHCELWGLADDDLSLPRAKILTAKKPYEHTHPEDKDIHDTHVKSTLETAFFPTHVNAIRHPLAPNEPLDPICIRKQLEELSNALSRQVARADARPYPESRNGFDIFGLDIMIVGAKPPHPHGDISVASPPHPHGDISVASPDPERVHVREANPRENSVTPRIVLLEVNDRVGYNTSDEVLANRFQEDYFKWVWNSGINPTL